MCIAVLVMLGWASAGQPLNESSNVLLRPADGFWGQQAPGRFRVRFATSEGDFVVEVNRDWAPLGADRFYNLVRAGFFDDSRFFRIRAGYIAQFGISGDPAVSAVWKSRSLEDDPVRRTNTRGTVAFAMTGPDTRTTQPYINLVDNTALDYQESDDGDNVGYCVFGKVVEGMDVVDRIAAAPVHDVGDFPNVPVETVVIESVTRVAAD